MKPNMISGLLLRGAWGIIALLLCSCDSKSVVPKPSEASREYWISNFEAMLKSNSYSDSHAQSVRDLLKELRQSPDPVKPRLIYADWSYNTQQKVYIIAIDYYDETRSVVGFRVREYGPDRSLILKEDYPVYPQPVKAYMGSIMVPFSPRSMDERRDENAWADYVQKKQINKQSLPNIWISVPANNRHVDISLLDLAGMESAAIRLRQERALDTSAQTTKTTNPATRQNGNVENH